MARKQLSFRVSPELYQQFIQKVEAEGKQSGKILEQLVEAYVNDSLPDGSNEVASSNTGRDEDIKKLVADEVATATNELRQEINQLKEMVASGSSVVEKSENGQADKVLANGSNEVANGSSKTHGKSYSVKELSELLGIGETQIRKKAKNNVADGDYELFLGGKEFWIKNYPKNGKGSYQFEERT